MEDILYPEDIVPVIGMSPGNSFFDEDNIKKLITDVRARYACRPVVIMIPSLPEQANWKALAAPDPIGKARKESNTLKNRVTRCLRELSCEDEVHVVDWEKEVGDLRTGKNVPQDMQIVYDNIVTLYYRSTDFRLAARQTTEQALRNKHQKCLERGDTVDSNINDDINRRVDIAVHYILAEISFMRRATKANYIYHKEWPIYERYISGAFDGTHPSLGFDLVRFGENKALRPGSPSFVKVGEGVGYGDTT